MGLVRSSGGVILDFVFRCIIFGKGWFMRVLVLGNDVYANCVVWSLRRSGGVEEVFRLPAGGGSWEEVPELREESRLLSWVEKRRVGVILDCLGIDASINYKEFYARGILVLAPSLKRRELLRDRLKWREILQKHSLPLVDFKCFEDRSQALSYMQSLDAFPYYLKPVRERGVWRVSSPLEARQVVSNLLRQPKSVDLPRRRLIVEEGVVGEEVRLLVLVGSRRILPLELVWHTRVGDGEGVGFYGSYAPYSSVYSAQMEQGVLVPLVHALEVEGYRQRGFLEVHQVLTKGGPKILDIGFGLRVFSIFPFLLRFGGRFLEDVVSFFRGDLEYIDGEGLPYGLVVSFGGGLGDRVLVGSLDGEEGLIGFYSEGGGGGGRCVLGFLASSLEEGLERLQVRLRGSLGEEGWRRYWKEFCRRLPLRVSF